MKRNNRIITILDGILLAGIPVFAQNKLTVTGTVKDETGAPVVGAVVMSDKSDAAIVDSDRHYTIYVSKESVSLMASCLGYSSQTETIGNRSKIDFVLVTDSELLAETVVVGYGSMKRSDLTGSVTAIRRMTFFHMNTIT